MKRMPKATNFLKHFQNIRVIRISAYGVVLVVAAGYTFWLLNEYVAFFGSHVIHVKNFQDPPASVSFASKYPVAMVSTSGGTAGQPERDRLEVRVTLPRGFSTMDVKAEFQTDARGQISLGATGQPGQPSIEENFILPNFFNQEWKIISVPGGRLVTKDHSINTKEEFWSKYSRSGKVVGIGPHPTALVPTLASPLSWQKIEIPYPIRGSFTVNALLGPETKSITFQKTELHFSPGKDKAVLVVEKEGVEVARQNLDSTLTVSGTQQKISLALQNLEVGFYTINFQMNNEDTMIQGLTFVGGEVQLSPSLLFGSYNKPISIYTTCEDIDVNPAKQAGLQAVNVNDTLYKITAVKKLVTIRTKNFKNSHIILEKGDIMVRAACGFTLANAEQPVRARMTALMGRIKLLQKFSTSDIDKADAVLATFRDAEKKNANYFVEKNFSLSAVGAKGKTFTFYLESPGLHSREGGFLYIKRITFIAHRPAFRFSDIVNFFQK